MSDSVDDSITVESDQIYSRISNWISNHDFRQEEDITEMNLPDNITDITSVTKTVERGKVKQRIVNPDGLIILDDMTDITSVTKTVEKGKVKQRNLKPGGLLILDDRTDITSITKTIEKEEVKQNNVQSDGLLIVEERTDEVNCDDAMHDSFENKVKCDDAMDTSLEKKSKSHFVRTLTKFSQYTPFEKNRITPPNNFSVIVEGEELKLPETKRSDVSFKSVKQSQPSCITATQPVPQRPSSNHKKYVDTSTCTEPNIIERKKRKKRTVETLSASVLFKHFLDSFIESTLVGAVLAIVDILLNSEQVYTGQSSSSSYF